MRTELELVFWFFSIDSQSRHLVWPGIQIVKVVRPVLSFISVKGYLFDFPPSSRCKSRVGFLCPIHSTVNLQRLPLRAPLNILFSDAFSLKRDLQPSQTVNEGPETPFSSNKWNLEWLLLVITSPHSHHTRYTKFTGKHHVNMLNLTRSYSMKHIQSSSCINTQWILGIGY